jgi:hypothetical protein
MVLTMRNFMACCGLVVLASAFAAHGQGPAAKQPTGLGLTAPSASTAILGSNFNFPLVATGGAAPYSWHLVDGQLPPGLKLKAHSGAISGVPATAGEYRFTVAAADSGAPALQAQRAMTITVIAGLTIDWKQYPKVQGATLSGSVVVTNQTGQDFDLTVVVVAVNSIGRATTLGYQHFTLAADKSGPVIPFSSSPGLGTYVVHADAVAHDFGVHRIIYRASKQTSQPLPITQH